MHDIRGIQRTEDILDYCRDKVWFTGPEVTLLTLFQNLTATIEDQADWFKRVHAQLGPESFDSLDLRALVKETGIEYYILSWARRAIDVFHQLKKLHVFPNDLVALEDILFYEPPPSSSSGYNHNGPNQFMSSSSCDQEMAELVNLLVDILREIEEEQISLQALVLLKLIVFLDKSKFLILIMGVSN